MSTPPRVTIGLPVYNGERFVARALDALLAQEFGDFELIVSDNASSDRTEEICRAYAAGDPRIRYLRQPRNLGAARNFNVLVALGRSELFKWMAADDELEPTYLRRCVEELDRAPHLVVAQALAVDIDEDGRELRTWTGQPQVDAPTPHERLGELLVREHQCFPVFGVIRRSALDRTAHIGAYTESDRVLVAELALQGPFVEIPEPLFRHREHRDRSVVMHRRSRARSGWFDPARADSVTFPTWRLGTEYARAIQRAPLDRGDRRRCVVQLALWSRRNANRLARNVAWAARESAQRGVRGPARRGRQAA